MDITIREKVNKPFVLLILNCEKYRHKAEKQNETWLKAIRENKDIDYFHIIGSKEKCAAMSKKHVFDNDKRILYTATNDDYLSLPDKIITAMNAINETYHYKYIFKTDDDQNLIQPSFFKTIMQLLSIPSNGSASGVGSANASGVSPYNASEVCAAPSIGVNGVSPYHYGGFKLSVPDHYSSYYMVHNELPKQLFLKATEYCNGRFYFLSKEAVENLLKKKDDISKHIIEDHAIGLYLDSKYKQKCLGLKTGNYFKDFTPLDV
jgi:hypothetical protein